MKSRLTILLLNSSIYHYLFVFVDILFFLSIELYTQTVFSNNAVHVLENQLIKMAPVLHPTLVFLDIMNGLSFLKQNQSKK